MMMMVLLVLLMLMLLLMAHCFQYGFSSGSPSSPSLPHPLHTHVSVAKFKQLLPANAFNGKTSFVAPNGAVAKVSFRFCFGFFLSAFRLFKYSLSLSKRPMSRLLLMQARSHFISRQRPQSRPAPLPFTYRVQALSSIWSSSARALLFTFKCAHNF